MRLWGKVATSLCLVFTTVFVITAVLSPAQRLEALGASAVMLIVGLVGVPLLVRALSAITGDEWVLMHGVAAEATITRIEPTRWRYNRHYPIVRFGLSLDATGGRQAIEVKQVVSPGVLEELAVGSVVGVRVDLRGQRRVVIDWEQPTRPPA